MKKILLALFISATTTALGLPTTTPTLVHAQTRVLAQDQVQNQQPQFQANAGDDRSTIANKKITFDASASLNSEADQKPTTYLWNFGDNSSASGISTSHTYPKAGEYIVRLTMTNADGRTSADDLLVSVYDKLIVLVTDKSTTQADIAQFERLTARQGRLLYVISDRSGNGDYIQEAQLTQSLLANSDIIRKADILITWTSGNTGLNILSQFAQASKNLSDLDFQHKTVVTITDQSFGVIARTAQATFDILRPESIILTKSASMNVIVDHPESTNLAGEIQKAEIEYSVIGIHSERAVDKLSPFNFMSYLVNYMVNKGIPINTITLILLFPIIATIIVFARQIIGLKAFGIYAPAIITLSFLALGVKVGLIIFLVVLIAGTLVRFILKRFHFFYFPKMALVLTGVALSLLVALAAMAYFNTTVIATSFFPMLLMIIIVEKFISVQIEKGSFEALTLSIETVILSIISYYILSWDVLQSFVINYPEIIIFVIVINIIIGRWTGLRLFELLRFREAIKYIEE